MNKKVLFIGLGVLALGAAYYFLVYKKPTVIGTTEKKSNVFATDVATNQSEKVSNDNRSKLNQGVQSL